MNVRNTHIWPVILFFYPVFSSLNFLKEITSLAIPISQNLYDMCLWWIDLRYFGLMYHNQCRYVSSWHISVYWSSIIGLLINLLWVSSSKGTCYLVPKPVAAHLWAGWDHQEASFGHFGLGEGMVTQISWKSDILEVRKHLDVPTFYPPTVSMVCIHQRYSFSKKAVSDGHGPS